MMLHLALCEQKGETRGVGCHDHLHTKRLGEDEIRDKPRNEYPRFSSLNESSWPECNRKAKICYKGQANTQNLLSNPVFEAIKIISRIVKIERSGVFF